MLFCGALNFDKRSVSFCELRKMYGPRRGGTAFINREIGIICDGEAQPLTVSYNGSLYTAAISTCSPVARSGGDAAQAVLQGYFEEGEAYVRRMDFPFALALYDSRCGELLLSKGAMGDRALFYTQRDGTLYFASSIKPLIRLLGGCLRINKAVLQRHLCGEYGALPEGLFCDLTPIRPDNSLLCSCFGHARVPTVGSVAPSAVERRDGEYSELFRGDVDVRRALNEALYAFDYPQFDCYMPYLNALLSEAHGAGKRELLVCDPMTDICERYAVERTDRLAQLWKLSVRTCACENSKLPSRYLKRMEREIDAILDEYMSDEGCIIGALDGECREHILNEKSTPLRIRKKGMLAQSAMWSEIFNIILV